MPLRRAFHPTAALAPILASLVSFAAGAQAPTACASRIVPYAERARVVAPEYLLDLANASGARLLYFGAEHSSDPTHPQFAQIDSLFAAVKPTVVFYEGPPRAEGATRRETIGKFGESGYIRFLAKQAGARIERLEDPAGEAPAMLQQFAVEQVQLFYVLREVAQLRERRGMSEAQLTAAAQQLLDRIAAMFPQMATGITTVDQLAAAYRRYWTSPAEWWQAPMRWFDPAHTSAETGGVFTNDINRASSEYRDRHMVEVLAAALARGERVMAVVGRDHVVAQGPALRCVMR